MEISGFSLEIARLVLYTLEFFSDIVVFGTVSNQLKAPVCAFKGKSGYCNTIIAFAVIAWLVLIAAIVWHAMVYVNKSALPYLLEAIIFAGLTVVWFVTALVTTAGSNVGSSSAKGAVRFFSWINIILHAGSALVAYFHSSVDGGNGEEGDVVGEGKA